MLIMHIGFLACFHAISLERSRFSKIATSFLKIIYVILCSYYHHSSELQFLQHCKLTGAHTCTCTKIQAIMFIVRCVSVFLYVCLLVYSAAEIAAAMIVGT